MPPSAYAADSYFETPVRTERLQLLLHLVRNADEVIYLRAPSGAGKTLFAERLLDLLGDDMAVVRVGAGQDSDIPAAAVGQLDVVGANMGPWPENIFAAIGEQGLLVVVDNADELAVMDMEYLDDLRRHGAHLLLIGHGGLPRQAGDNWQVNFVDLPGFDADESMRFLLANAGEHALKVSEGLAAALHRAAQGQPGPLLAGLNEVLLRSQGSPAKEAKPPMPVGRPAWQWIAGGAIVILLGAILVFQDEINALFEPAAEAIAVDVEVPELSAPSGPVAIEPPAGKPGVTAAMRSEPSVAADELAADGIATDALVDGSSMESVPEIALPELTPLVADSAYEKAAPAIAAVEEAKTEVAKPAETAPQEAPSEPAKTSPAAEDPLAAVMQDAMTAAGSGASAKAVTPEPRKTAAEAAPPLPAPEPLVTVRDPDPLASDGPGVQLSALREPPAAQPKPADVTVSEPALEKAKPVEAPPSRADVVDGRRGAAPVEDRTAPLVQEKVEEKTVLATASSAPKPVTAPASGVAKGVEWLKSRPATHYTLQLLGARDKAAIQKYIQLHAVEAPYAIFERPLNGKPWFSLVAGDYPSRSAALAARSRLPADMRTSDIWPRTFASIKKTL